MVCFERVARGDGKRLSREARQRREKGIVGKFFVLGREGLCDWKADCLVGDDPFANAASI